MRLNLPVAACGVAFAIAASRPVAAQLMAPPAVNPARYESRSGRCVLEVDPSDLHGAGGATYRLSCDAREAWSGERPYTLLDAAVSDDGAVAGYAYTGGLEGFAKDDTLHLIVLGPNGDRRLDDATPRQQSRVVDGGPEPNVHGLVFDPDNDRVVFRVANVADPQTWKPFRLSTGEALKAFRPDLLMPKSDLSLWITDAQPVRSTPLTLIHWHRSGSEAEQSGARFTLVDLSGRPEWVLDFPTEYQAPRGDAKAQERLSRIASETAILDVSRPNEFELRLTGGSERVRYRVERGERGRWTVSEAGRLPYVEPAPPAVASHESIPERQLRYLGAIRLTGGDEAGQALRKVQQFDLDDQGRFGFARDDGECTLTMVMGTPGQDKADEIALGRLKQYCSAPLVAWAGGKTWLVTMTYAKAEDGDAGWWVDTGSGGGIRPFRLPAGVSVRAVAGRPTGGFVLLAERRTTTSWGYENDTALMWLNAQGQEERAFSETANTSDSKLLSPDDLAVTSTGEVVVVDVIRHLVAVFGPDGRLRRTIDLQKTWGREPGYPSGIAPDVDGGFIVEDFNTPVPFIRMRPDGSVRGELRPRYEDGRSTGRLFRVRADATGAVWGSDGEAILRLGEDGVVEGAAGAPASAEQLGEVAGLVVDAADRIYAADRRSGAVHVYSPEGKLQHICRPDPGDVRDALDSPSLTVTDDGRVLLRPDRGLEEEGAFLEFSPTGERIGRHSWRDRARLWNPVTRGFWSVGFEDLAMIDDHGGIGRRVARRLDRRWLEWISGAVVAPDGSIAVAAHANLLQAAPAETTINIIGSDGVPTRMLRLPAETGDGRFAYDGRSLAVWQSGEVWLFSGADTPVARFKPRVAGKDAIDWPLLIAAQGRELWMFEASTKSIHRFELP